MIPFQVLGRSRQPQVASASHLADLVTLEDALWAATAAPVAAFHLDPVFLAHLDADADGRIRSDEVRAAARWCLEHLQDHAEVRAGNNTLKLGALAASAAEGPTLRDAARRILTELGKSTSTTLTLQEVRGVRAAEEARGLSAAGKVLPAAAGDDAPLSSFLQHVLAVTGGEPHPLGGSAVTTATLDKFLAEGASFLTWSARGDFSPGNPIQPLGSNTAAAVAATEAVSAKLEQYFLLCDAIRLDGALADRARVDPTGTDLLDPVAATALLEKAPVAPPHPDGVLRLDGALNPAWLARIQAFEAAVAPLVPNGRALDRAGFQKIRDTLAPHRTWAAEKPTTSASSSDPAVLASHVADVALHDRTRALIAASEVASVALDGVKLVEKLILLQANLLPFARNFACFPDLFDTTVRAPIERGRVVLDGRVFDLALPVLDAGRAERYAAMSPLFVLFVMVGPKGGSMTEEWAVPVTAGERQHLVEGQWGIAINLEGEELHAQIRKIVVSPISIREALLAPFRRIGDTIQGMFDRAAAAQQSSMDSAITAKAQAAVDTTSSAPDQLLAQGQAATAKAPDAPATPPPPTVAAPATGGMGQLPLLVAGGGVALAALGAAVLQVFELLGSATVSLSQWLDALIPDALLPGPTSHILHALSAPVAVMLVLLGVALIPVLAYALPISIATWLRLRRRDLSTLLEGAGWAVNTRLLMDNSLAGRLTRRPNPPR